jgi:arginyl-tRNA synthetase
MSELSDALATIFSDALVLAFGPEHQGTDPMLRRSDRADFQANLAMGLGKKLGKPPRQVAETLLAHIKPSALIEHIEIAGPGFFNITLKAQALTDHARRMAEHPKQGVHPASPKDRVVVDYSGPNVAKEMHVGHLRSTIIGDALCRVLAAVGHEVIRQNHLGDWGTPFGMLIEHMLDLGDTTSAQVSDLNAFYQAARAKFDADPAFQDRARKRVVLLQGGDADTLSLWRSLCAVSRSYFEKCYAELGVLLTDADVAGESTYNALLPGVVQELEQLGLSTISDGAACVFLPGYVGKDDAPVPLIIRKQDGGYSYATTDLAAIKHRTGTLGATRILYCVGAPQAQHLNMVFDTAKRAGWLKPGVRAEHVAFGSVLGADKKIMRTRAGESIKLMELIDEAITRATATIAEKNPEVQAAELARAVGLGAIKYVDLSSDRIKDYVFDWDRMLAFEGNTAPYIMYAHARIASITRKADDALRGAQIDIQAPAERALALELLGFGDVVHDVAITLQPHKICGYLYGLAVRFSTFYQECPVLKAETQEQARARLSLCALTAQTLKAGLALLGIEAPDKM